MKLKYKELVRNYSWLTEIGALVLPRKITVAISRNMVMFEKEIETMNKQREDAVKRYALMNEDGTPVVENNQYTFASDEDKAAFVKELQEIDETEFDLNIVTFDESELDRCDEVDRYSILTAVQEVKLDWMMNKEKKES